jgi:hypothetical protein
MRIRRIVNRIIRCISISLLLPLVLALPLVAFAPGNNGNHGNGNNGNHGNGNNGEHGNGNRGKHGGDDGGGNDGGGGAGPALPLVGAADSGDSAPEINLASINAAMALLVGGAMWLRHRK